MELPKITQKQRNRAAFHRRLQQTFKLSADSAAPTPQYRMRTSDFPYQGSTGDQKLIRHVKTSST